MKSKRRSIPVPPASIWGDTEKLFKAALGRASEPLPLKKDDAVAASAPSASEPVGEVQPRRILPDLRATQIQVDEEAVTIRVKPRRTQKNSGEHPPRDEGHTKRRKKAIVDVGDVDVVSTPTAKIVLVGKKERGNAQNVRPSIAPSSAIVIAPKPHVEIAYSPIMIQPMSPRRDRKWVLSVEELPRGQRWKRRLPDVCR